MNKNFIRIHRKDIIMLTKDEFDDRMTKLSFELQVCKTLSNVLNYAMDEKCFLENDAINLSEVLYRQICSIKDIIDGYLTE